MGVAPFVRRKGAVDVGVPGKYYLLESYSGFWNLESHTARLGRGYWAGNMHELGNGLNKG